MNTLISILSPVKNESRYICEMIDSVLSQSYSNWELIIVDDHSNDDTVVCVESYSDERIKVVSNHGVGIVDALSTAFGVSVGSYITRMDGDDVMPANKLELLFKAYRGVTKRVVTGNVRYFSDKPISKGYKSYESWLNKVCDQSFFKREMFRECVVASGNWLCSREDLITVGFPSRLNYPEDYDLVLKWYKHGFEFVGVKACTHLWREHEQRTSRNSDVYEQKSFFKLKLKYFSELVAPKSKELLVFGVNDKTKLTVPELDSSYDKITLISIDKGQIGQVAFGRKVIHLTDTIYVPENQHVLVVVYPDEHQRNQLEIFLEEKGFVFGVNCWYL